MKDKPSISLDPIVHEKIKKLAAKVKRSKSYYINMVLEKHIQQIEDSKKKKE